MFWLQDIVPNHMVFDSENRMLMDVFENGENSLFRDYFDIEWKHIHSSMRGRVLAPFLGKFYSECLEAGELRIDYEGSGLSINYYSLKFPLKIESYPGIFERNSEKLKDLRAKDNAAYSKHIGNINLIKNIRRNNKAAVEQIRRFKKMMWSLFEESESVRDFVRGNLAQINGTPGYNASFNELDKLLNEQCFRLSFWKVASGQAPAV